MAEKIRDENGKPRLTEKADMPSEEFVRLFMGADAWAQLMRFEELLGERYDLNREMRFPFGNKYGWGLPLCPQKNVAMLCVF